MTDWFKNLDSSPTATCESKVQRTFRKMKSKFTELEYCQLYPTGLNAGKSYSTTKLHNLKQRDTVDQRPLRSIVSNCGTASYKLAKNLAKLLSSLSKSQYTVQSTKEFINHQKYHKILKLFLLTSLGYLLTYQ